MFHTRLCFILCFLLSCQKDDGYHIPFPEEGRYDCPEYLFGDTRRQGFVTVTIDGTEYTGTSVIAEDENGEWVFLGALYDDACLVVGSIRANFRDKDVPSITSDFPLENSDCFSGLDSNRLLPEYDSRRFNFSWRHGDEFLNTYACKTNEYDAVINLDKYHGAQEVIEGTLRANLFLDSICFQGGIIRNDVLIEEGYFQAVVYPFDSF